MSPAHEELRASAALFADAVGTWLGYVIPPAFAEGHEVAVENFADGVSRLIANAPARNPDESAGVVERSLASELVARMEEAARSQLSNPSKPDQPWRPGDAPSTPPH